MPIDRLPEWRLNAEDETQIAALLARAFTTDFGGRSFFQLRHHLRLVERQGDQVVGHVALLLRAVRLDDRLLNIAGLAEVATHPDHRGKGIAATLLQAAIGEAKESPAEFLLLFGTAPLYAGAGFVQARNPLIYLDMGDARSHEVRREPAQALMVLSLRGKAWDEAATLDLLGNLF